MWTHEESVETTATPAQIWKLFSDVIGWKEWNAGIESVEIHGPFDVGTTFTMQPPGEEQFTSTLVEVEENKGFTDETVINDTRVLVRHKVTLLPSGNTKIIYSTEIIGPNAEEFGAMVTSDFPDVLKALKALAEKSK
jgi:hypothetical protein